MLLFISDANILIDIEVADLAAPMFGLDYQFAVPDILYYEELEEQHSHLIDIGLEVRGLDEAMVAQVGILAIQYAKPSRNDLFALVLAASEQCPLLTGDRDLKSAAENENVEVRGTLWLVEEMVKSRRITAHVARDAYERMRTNGRRLPWDLAESSLREIERLNER
jgi:predicted nucleic acid-binding protein